MSDMSRPRSIPPAPDHQQHDPLLVAQLAAGDRLAEAQRREAQRLVSTCGACADLAADLAAVSGAVAWEPAPPRRRDFRLDPEQAERLQGNAVTRFLRRLSLPQARAFSPTAAGVLSLGLVFMLAGSVWPEGGAVRLGGDSEVVPQSTIAEPSATETTVAAPLEVLPPAVGGLAAEEAADYNAYAPDVLAEDPANLEGAHEGNAKRALTEDRWERASDEVESSTGSAPAAVEVDSAADVEMQRSTSGEVDALEAATVEELSVVSGLDDAVADESAAGLGPLDKAAGDDGLDFESLLLIVGFGMALTGGALLLLAWLVRRTRGPLPG